jgi:hypothetical protein
VSGWPHATIRLVDFEQPRDKSGIARQAYLIIVRSTAIDESLAWR